MLKSINYVYVGIAAAAIFFMINCINDNVVNGNNTYTLTVDTDSLTVGGSVDPKSKPGISAGISVDITAIAYNGYKFVSWTVTNGTASFGNANSATTTVTLSSNATIKANFLRDHFNSNINYGKFTDSRDGHVYHTVTIGAQTWMAENLNYGGSGDDIGVCYNDEPDSCVKYGRLYTWAEAMAIDSKFNSTLWNGNAEEHQGVCPVGWRLPTDVDWDDLMSVVGGIYVGSVFGDGGWWEGAGTKLKSKIGWNQRSDDSSGDGEDDYGFSVLPGGYYNMDGYFWDVGGSGYWWNAAKSVADNVQWLSMSIYDNVDLGWSYKSSGVSVRCLRG